MLFRVTQKKFYEVDINVIHERKHVPEFGELTLVVEDRELHYKNQKGTVLVRLKRDCHKPIYLVDHRLLRTLKRDVAAPSCIRGGAWPCEPQLRLCDDIRCTIRGED